LGLLQSGSLAAVLLSKFKPIARLANRYNESLDATIPESEQNDSKNRAGYRR
jgi:hypothetical protein